VTSQVPVLKTVPVLEIGGSHVSAVRVHTTSFSVEVRNICTMTLDSHGTADELIAAIVHCAQELGPMTGERLSVAIPGPFDYASGIGRFAAVGKFETLNGIDLRQNLLSALPNPPASITFLNDAHAFTLGEWRSGAGRGSHRIVGITLGTGVGSAFLVDGVPVERGIAVPPQGRVDLLTIDGAPLEDLISSRAILARYGGGVTEVRAVFERARAGEVRAAALLTATFFTLGSVLAPWISSFAADALIIGGSMTGSWDLLEPQLSAGLTSAGCDVKPQPATHLQAAPLIGAAWAVARSAHPAPSAA